MKIKEEFHNISENSSKSFNLSIIYLILALFTFCYFGSCSFFDKVFEATDHDYWRMIYHNLMAFLIFFIFGILYVKLVMRESLKKCGLKVGNWKFGLIVMGIASLVIPLLALSTSIDPEMISAYPLIDLGLYNSWWQILLYFTSYLLYYIGWEFLFRGLALHLTKEKVGVLGAILLTTLISALIHTSIGAFGKPMLETLSAIPAGIIFAYISYRSDSIYYSLYCHTLIGFLTDIFIYLICF